MSESEMPKQLKEIRDEKASQQDEHLKQIKRVELNGMSAWARGANNFKAGFQACYEAMQSLSNEREDEPKSKSDEVQKLLRLIAVESAKVRELESWAKLDHLGITSRMLELFEQRRESDEKAKDLERKVDSAIYELTYITTLWDNDIKGIAQRAIDRICASTDKEQKQL
jgi:type II secretory pathway component PulK